MQYPKLDQKLAREAKAIVALAFRNGPIENIHSGKTCPTCSGRAGYPRITEAEMIMKNAVDHVYKFSVLKKADPVRCEKLVEYGNDRKGETGKLAIVRDCENNSPRRLAARNSTPLRRAF